MMPFLSEPGQLATDRVWSRGLRLTWAIVR
jgi:hypothetical protein